MALVTHSVKNLINGVSQQSPNVRLDNQMEEQINMVSDPAFGLIKRNPIELISEKPFTGAYDHLEEDAMFTYTDKDETRASIGVRKNGTVYRFDNNGIKIINQTDLSYLVHTDKNDIEFLETNDELLILNKGVIVSEVSTAPTNYFDKGLVWLRSVTVGNTYRLTIKKNGSIIYNNTDLAASGDTPSDILGAFAGAVDALPDVNLAATFSNSLYIDFNPEARPVLNTYSVEFSDEYGVDDVNALMSATEEQDGFITDASVLPTLNISGSGFPYVARISPSSNIEGVYYLGWSAEDRLWTEYKLNDYLVFDPLTVPKVIYKGQADIPVVPMPLDDMAVGDINSNKKPSFLNNNITDMYLYQGRLVFASNNNLSFSEAGNKFNFYRTSTATLLGSDRIDIELQSNRLGYKEIENIFGTEGSLYVNTGDSQAVLQTTTDLDLTKSKFAEVSAHSLGEAQPVHIGNTVYFIKSNSNLTNVRGFRAEGTAHELLDITKHCEKYIKGDILEAVYSNDFLLLRTDDNPRVIYVQKSYKQGEQLVQNAWSKWEFPSPYTIKHMYNDGSTVHFTFDDSFENRTLYASLPLELPSNVADVYTQTSPTTGNTVIGYFPYLDFWQRDSMLATEVIGTIHVHEIEGNIEPSAGVNIISGVPFSETSVTLSEQVPRVQEQDGASKLGFSKMMLRRIQGTLGFTGRLDIEITKKGRGTTVQKHMPKPIGNLIIGREAVNDTDLKFSVNGRAEDVQVKIVDKGIFTPFNFISFEYQAQLITRGSRF